MGVIEGSIPRFSWSGISFMKFNQSYFKPFSVYSPWNYFLDLPIMCRKYINVHKINTKAFMRVIEESIPRFSWAGVSFMKSNQSYFKPFSSFSPQSVTFVTMQLHPENLWICIKSYVKPIWERSILMFLWSRIFLVKLIKSYFISFSHHFHFIGPCTSLISFQLYFHQFHVCENIRIDIKSKLN